MTEVQEKEKEIIQLVNLLHDSVIKTELDKETLRRSFMTFDLNLIIDEMEIEMDLEYRYDDKLHVSFLTSSELKIRKFKLAQFVHYVFNNGHYMELKTALEGVLLENI